MSDAPYIPFYTSDFLGGTGGMTAATKGVYITLLCLMYEAEGPISQSWETLARRCGCTLPAFKRSVEALQDDGKIEVTETGLWSEKCEKHVTLRRGRRSSAKAAAKKRWQKSEQKQAKSDATALIPQCENDANQNQNQSKKEEGKPSSKKVGARLPSDWVLPDDWLLWSISEGMPKERALFEADKFRDYWIARAGQGGVKLNWQATWRNWCRRVIEQMPGGGNGKSPTDNERIEIAAAEAAKRSFPH